MDRESQELRTYSQSWPPGFFVGSVTMENGARARRRHGLMLVALAVCGWCLGYGITDWVCDENQRKLAAASAQLFQRDAIAQDRGHTAAAPVADRQDQSHAGAAPVALQVAVAERVVAEPTVVADAAVESKPAVATPAAATEAAGALEAAALAEVAAVAPAAHNPPLSAATRPLQIAKRASAAASLRNCCKPAAGKLAWSEEPSPAISPQEMNRALVFAAASKKIFASVDESSPSAQPATERVVLQPAAAAAPDTMMAAVEAKGVAIESLYVEGGVPSRVVNRGVQRLLPQYDRCRELCDSAPQRMKLSTTIDEAGRGRQVTVEGLSRPGLRRCLEQATAHLVVPAPDTGTARARWIVRFASR